MNNLKIIAIVGKSASGKSTIISDLIKENTNKYHIVKSFTTRGIRYDDPNDINTHEFVSNKYWEDNKDNAIAVYHSPKGYTSWVDINSFDKNKINLYAIDPIAVSNELYPHCFDNNIMFDCIYIECDEDTRKQRYINREGNLDKYSEEEHLDEIHLCHVPHYLIKSQDSRQVNLVNAMACIEWIEEDWNRIDYNNIRG